MTNDKRLKDLVIWLEKAFPLPWPSEVKRVKNIVLGPDCHGKLVEGESLGASLLVLDNEGKELAEIQLLESLPWVFLKDTLFHEWAHLRRQIGHVGCGCGKSICEVSRHSHDDEFYLEFGRINQRYDM